MTQTATRAPESSPVQTALSALSTTLSAFKRIASAARRPVAADSVAVFRIGYGLLVAFSSIRFLAKGWVDALYLDPAHHLTYRWFEWVRPFPAPWMQLHMAALAGLGLCIALGYRHRLAAALFLVGFGYTELIEASLYLNHYWFITLSGALLLLLPVQHHWSLDAAQGRVAACERVAAGTVWALRAQVAVVYVFAGLAKLNPDWLWQAQPLRLWLADRTHVPLVGSLLDESAVAYLSSWSSAAFDCTIVGWLLWRRSRPWAYAVVVVFHLTTGALFRIGVFGWVMIMAALIFFEPDWPRRLAGGHPGRGRRPLAAAGGSVPQVDRGALTALALLAAAQIVLPLRHYAIDGNVRWTEEGYYLAWRVMLTEKAGHFEFTVTDPVTSRSQVVDPTVVLTDWQVSHAATRPDLIHATAHLVADHERRQGVADPQVRARAWVAMNGRPARQIIDPDVDLAAHPRSSPPAGWILDP